MLQKVFAILYTLELQITRFRSGFVIIFFFTTSITTANFSPYTLLYFTLLCTVLALFFSVIFILFVMFM